MQNDKPIKTDISGIFSNLIFRFKKILFIILFIIVCVGIYIWLYNTEQTTNISVQVDWNLIPKEYMIKGEVENIITVLIQGKPAIINSVPEMAMTYQPNLTRIEEGASYIEIRKDEFAFPEGIKILNITPSMITYVLERVVEKEVPVKLMISGTPSERYFVSEILVYPGKIKFCAPKPIIDKIDEIATKPIEIQGITESFKKEVVLSIEDYLLPYISNKIVKIDVTISENIETKLLQNIPVKGINSVYAYVIRPSTIQLEIEGAISSLETLNPEKDINVYLDLKGLKPGVYARRLKIELSGKITLIGVKPEIFTVTIKR